MATLLGTHSSVCAWSEHGVYCGLFDALVPFPIVVLDGIIRNATLLLCGMGWHLALGW